MKKYSWKSMGFDNVDPQLVGEELEIIERNGELTHLHVLEYAKRHKDSELYKCFEWDDSVAGEMYRREQASRVVSHIAYTVVDENTEEKSYKQKVYVSLQNENKQRVFKHISKVLQDDDDYEQLLQKCRDQLSRVKKDYERLLNREDLKELFFSVYTNI